MREGDPTARHGVEDFEEVTVALAYNSAQVYREKNNMAWPHDLGTWGFILSIVAIVLTYPIGVLINLTTPTIADWLSKRTKVSLGKRITKLQAELADMDQGSPIDDFQNQVLWGFTSLEIKIHGTENGILLVLWWMVTFFSTSSDPHRSEFSWGILIIYVFNMIRMLRLRYRRDYRYKHLPANRENLKKAIKQLTALYDNWGMKA